MNLNGAFLPGFSVVRAQELQKRLSGLLIAEDCLPRKIKYVAGVDVAYTGNKAICAVVVLDYSTLGLLESRTATCEAKFPYVPTLLSFREIPPAVACIRKLKLQPDVFLVDGHGMAHPFRCGFASHLGLAVQKPTIGVAKSSLIGIPVKVGSEIFLSYDGQIVGSEVLTKKGSKPVYVSIGHMVSLKRAIQIAKHCACSCRIPEPLRIAHSIASEEKTRWEAENRNQQG
jgi:deoxyribonuclease V